MQQASKFFGIACTLVLACALPATAQTAAADQPVLIAIPEVFPIIPGVPAIREQQGAPVLVVRYPSRSGSIDRIIIHRHAATAERLAIALAVLQHQRSEDPELSDLSVVPVPEGLAMDALDPGAHPSTERFAALAGRLAALLASPVSEVEGLGDARSITLRGGQIRDFHFRSQPRRTRD